MVKIIVEGMPQEVKKAEEQLQKIFRITRKNTTYPLKGTGFMRSTIEAYMIPPKKYPTAPTPKPESDKQPDIVIVEFQGKKETEEKRYAIANKESGEILDDCNGYGFKSPEKAMAKWDYEHKSI